MGFLKVAEGLIINLDSVKGIEKTTDGLARFFIGLDYATETVVSTFLTFEAAEQIVRSRELSESKMQRNLDQLARYQATPIP